MKPKHIRDIHLGSKPAFKKPVLILSVKRKGREETFILPITKKVFDALYDRFDATVEG